MKIENQRKHEESGPNSAGDQGPEGRGNGRDKPDPATVTIVVNGRAKKVPKHVELSFWDVVKLAFENPQTGDDIQYTVQYTRGPGNRPSGTLVEGQSVKVKDRMEFDVTSTNRS